MLIGRGSNSDRLCSKPELGEFHQTCVWHLHKSAGVAGRCSSFPRPHAVLFRWRSSEDGVSSAPSRGSFHPTSPLSITARWRLSSVCFGASSPGRASVILFTPRDHPALWRRKDSETVLKSDGLSQPEPEPNQICFSTSLNLTLSSVHHHVAAIAKKKGSCLFCTSASRCVW